MNDDDEVALTVGGQTISGWNDIRITRGMERLPSDFDIGMTELYPAELDEIVVEPGDFFNLKIGGDLVIAGYVDHYRPGFNASSHHVRCTGRSKCQDLVDCAAEWENGEINGASAFEVAKKLAGVYGGSAQPLTVSCTETDLRIIPQFNLILGETAQEIIERICRYSSLLVFDGADGNLILARAGIDTMASGFEEGVNVEAADIDYSADQRYSSYTAFVQSMAVSSIQGTAGNLISTTTDAGVKRNRKRNIIAEATVGFLEVASQRAVWEMNRRIGRSTIIYLVTDSWRDSAGALWEPNKLVSVYLPSLKMTAPVTWLISDVTFKMNGESGTTAELVIMHPDAFQVEPMALQQSNLIDTSTINLTP